jgi:hypothetical protein
MGFTQVNLTGFHVYITRAKDALILVSPDYRIASRQWLVIPRLQSGRSLNHPDLTVMVKSHSELIAR